MVIALLTTLVSLTLLASASRAATPLDSTSVSSDTTIILGGVTVEDEDVAIDNPLGIIVPASLADLPEATDVNSYHSLPNGDQLVPFDTTVSLPSDLTAEPGDPVRYDGISYTLEFDPSVESVPSCPITDAVSTTTAGDLLLSFDTAVELPTASGTDAFDDEDLVRFKGSALAPVFDGSAEAVPAALDLDGAHDLGNGKLGLSFDGSGNLDTVDFDDEDVFECDPRGIRLGP